MVNQLIILENGFDRASDLKSGYMDFSILDLKIQTVLVVFGIIFWDHVIIKNGLAIYGVILRN